MVSCRQVVSAFVLLSFISTLAFSQDKSDSYLDQQIQKRIDEIEKNVSEIKELVKLRTSASAIPAWGRLGITGKTVSVDLPDEPYTGGVTISEIETGSPADAMGLEAGDVIVVFDGSKTPSLEELAIQVDKSSGRKVRFPKMIILRDGELYVTSRLARFPRK